MKLQTFALDQVRRDALNLDVGGGGGNSSDRVEKFPASDGQIACHFLHFVKAEDIWLKSAVFGKNPLPTIYRRNVQK